MSTLPTVNVALAMTAETLHAILDALDAGTMTVDAACTLASRVVQDYALHAAPARKFTETECIERAARGEIIVFIDEDERPGTASNVARPARAWKGDSQVYRMSKRYTLDEARARYRALGYGWFQLGDGTMQPLT